MNRVIITGATGAIGTALIEEFVKEGIEVLVFCRKGSPRNHKIPNDPLVSKEYCSLDEFETKQNNTGKKFDVFYHLAWDGTTGIARDDMYLQNRNVKYALDAVEMAKRFGCHTFVGAGSQAEYGRVQGLLSSDTPVSPENGYGIAKLCAGLMTRELAHQIGLKHIWMRILSVYGPNDGAQSMVMSTIYKLKNGEIPKFTKGEQMWDYLYSGDAAKAFALVGKKGKDGKVYILGSGYARPLAEYITEIRDVVKPEAAIALGAIPYRPQQVMFLQADNENLIHDTGWKPETPFKKGIENILERDIHNE